MTNNEERVVPVLALPVSVEQIAATVRQMRPADQQRLLNMVPELRQVAIQGPPRTADEARASAERLRAEVVLANQRLSPDDPFLGGLTLRHYLDLPDEERARLWEGEADVDLYEVKEREVQPDAMPFSGSWGDSDTTRKIGEGAMRLLRD